MTTKTVSVADQLEKLTAAKNKAYVEVQRAKRKRNAFDAETQALQAEHSVRHETFPEEYARDRNHLPLANTDAEKLANTLKDRLRNANPVQVELDATIAKFHDAEIAERNFRINNLELLIDEIAPQADAQELADAWATVARLADDYHGAVERVRQLIIDMPTFEGRDIELDPRVQAWTDMAADAIENAPLMPHIKGDCTWKLDNLRYRIEADRNE